MVITKEKPVADNTKDHDKGMKPYHDKNSSNQSRRQQDKKQETNDLQDRKQLTKR